MMVSVSVQQVVQLLQQGRFQDALQTINRLPKSTSQTAQVLHWTAICHDRLGQQDDAEKFYQRALKVNPDAPELYIHYADLKRGMGLYDAATEISNRAIKKFPQNPETWFARALTWDLAGNPEKAASDYRQVVELKKDHAIAWSNLGQVLRKAGDLEEARSALNKALELRPQHPQTLAKRANVLHDLGFLEESLADQVIALKALPNDPAILSGYARGCQRLGKTDQALAAYSRAIQGTPDDLSLHWDFNRLLWETGQKENILDSLNYAISKTDPLHHGGLWALKGELARRTGQDGLAEQAFSEALPAVQHPNDRASVLAGLAGIAHRRQEYDQADKMYSEAVQLESLGMKVRHSYANFLLEQSRFSEALSLLEPDAPKDDLQRHIALRALACRAMGDVRYRHWYDYDRFVGKREITPPARFASLELFLEAVGEALEPVFSTEQAPLDQTLFNGVQTPGNLWHINDPVLQELKSCLWQTVREHIESISGSNDDEDHPFMYTLAARPDLQQHLKYSGAWSVRLTEEGGHVDHIHPDGWLSASHYVSVPAQMGREENSKAGWLRLGGSGVKGLDMAPERYVLPEPGHIIMFPSYMWHGVEPLETTQPRITTPFDMVIGQ